MQQPLVLRDIHQPPAPSWWPPAPGWWWLAAIVLVLVALVLWWWLRRRRRCAQIMRAFDDRVDAPATPAARVAAMSELLRRAARHRDPSADRLDGSAWLLFLDGHGSKAPTTAFSQGPGQVLLEGGFRPTVAEDEVAALLPLARKRYLELMAARPSAGSR